MLLLPENLQNSNLCNDARRSLQSLKNRLPNTYIGIDQVNLTGIAEDNHVAILSPHGLLLLRYFEDDISNATKQLIYKLSHTAASEAVRDRLMTHTVLKNHLGKLLFPIRIVYVLLDYDELPEELDDDLKVNCRGKGWLAALRKESETEIAALLSDSFSDYELPEGGLSQDIINVIINRIAPWCTIPRIPDHAPLKKVVTRPLDDNAGKLPSGDSIIEVLRLDNRQVDMVNAIRRGHQLILACAGSGKSVLLIAKCFKLASCDSKKKYLLTCYNRNLNNYYDWQIDEAGFRDRNVDCFTFHALCKKLLDDHRIPVSETSNFDNQDYVDVLYEKTYQAIQSGQIKTRYYGIFIDEVQIFDPKWYRLCHSLLEDPSGDNHVFVICGDLTQDIKKNVKRGAAPWQGEGLPVFKGRTTHIESNYRNSIPINAFINAYSDVASDYIRKVDPSFQQDRFLRGKAMRGGSSPVLTTYDALSSEAEAQAILNAIQHMHDDCHIGYTDLAVLLYNQESKKRLLNWSGLYFIKKHLEVLLRKHAIPHVELSWNNWQVKSSYQARRGVSILTYEGALGIDYRGVVVAGLPLIGHRLGVARDNAHSILQKSDDEREEYISGFNALYLACTRAKDFLTVVSPAPDKYISVYIRAVCEAFDRYENTGVPSPVETTI